jgi:tRNA (guanine-N7-)-methyltransferase
MTPGQARAWESAAAHYLVEVPRSGRNTSVDPAFRFDAPAVFGRTAPLVIEIGTGRGENIVAAAMADRDRDFLGLEVYRPGLAQTMLRATEAVGRIRTRLQSPSERGDGDSGDTARFVESGTVPAWPRSTLDDGPSGVPGSTLDDGLANLRLVEADAADFLRTALMPSSVAEVWTFFPDPWPKARHHKRRLVGAEFAAQVARVVAPGGVWRLATDWGDYAASMLEVLASQPLWASVRATSAVDQRFAGRAVTAFERRGLDAGRSVIEITAVRA